MAPLAVSSAPLFAHAMQQTYVESTINLHAFLPFSRVSTKKILLLPWSSAKPRQTYMVSSADKARKVAIARVPWLGEVWKALPKVSLTGSLLLECIAPVPGCALLASDVDLFIDSPEGLDSLRDTVLSAMQAFAVENGYSEPVVERRSSRRYTVQICPFRSVIGKVYDRAALNCDVYVNSFSKVARYHLPAVRMALNMTEMIILPSCAIALATRVCIDYHYFASAAKTPYDIIARKWNTGYNFVVNEKEQRQLWYYLRNFSSDSKVNFDGDLKVCYVNLQHPVEDALSKRYLARRRPSR